MKFDSSSIVFGLVFELLTLASGQITQICSEYFMEVDCTPTECQWVDDSACVCVEDSSDIDIWFLIESNVSEDIWNQLMLQLPSDYVEYIQNDDTNVKLMRFGDNTVDVLENPSINEINNWSYSDESTSTVCYALTMLENYLSISNRATMVVTMFANGIDDGPCDTTSLSADIVYGMIDSLYVNDFETLLNYDAVAEMDFSTTDEMTIKLMEKYVLSAISDFACILEPITPSPTSNPTVKQPTHSPTVEYVPYVNWVYKRWKPKQIGRERRWAR